MKCHENCSSGGEGGVELFHDDGRTDMMNLIVTLRNFSKLA